MTHSTFSTWVDKLHQTSPKLANKLSLAVSSSAILTYSTVAGLPLFALGAVKLATQPLKGNPLGLKTLGRRADNAIVDVAQNWIGINNWLIDHVLPSKQWHIHMDDSIEQGKNYLLICNHQSWVDTSIIQYVSQGRLPLTRFFAKHELLYIPIVGQAFYLLDFPMMKRHSKEAIAKNPALAGKDLAEARRACQLLVDKPFVLLNYLEGTRFSPKKHELQQSPFKHLLKPKAGGFALALSALGDKIDGILDMTIVYGDGVPQYHELWEGKTKHLAVDIRPVSMDDELLDALKQGQYSDNPAIKTALHDWLDGVWHAKDSRIEQTKNEFQKSSF